MRAASSLMPAWRSACPASSGWRHVAASVSGAMNSGTMRLSTYWRSIASAHVQLRRREVRRRRQPHVEAPEERGPRRRSGAVSHGVSIGVDVLHDDHDAVVAVVAHGVHRGQAHAGRQERAEVGRGTGRPRSATRVVASARARISGGSRSSRSQWRNDCTTLTNTDHVGPMIRYRPPVVGVGES